MRGLIDRALAWVSDHAWRGYGGTTNIEGYTTKANAYVFPSDGIIRIQCRYTSGNYIGCTVCNADGTNEFVVQIGSEGTSMKMTAFPVFKGQKAWRSSNNGTNNFIEFHPFINAGGYCLTLLRAISMDWRWQHE